MTSWARTFPRRLPRIALGRASLLAAVLVLAARAIAAPEDSAPPVTVTDLMGEAHDLKSIAAGRSTLLFICDPALTRCREGAVQFDSQAARIEQLGIRPACVLLASPEAAQEAAARLGLGVPVYVDAARAIPGALLGQEILPAMVLVDGGGNVEKVLLGGGESLDSNLTHMLEGQGQHHWRFLAILIPPAVFGIILLILG